MPTKTSRSALLEKPSLAYSLSCSFKLHSRLKRILRRKLKNPGIEGALDHAKGRRRQPVHRGIEVCMIHCVKKLKTQFKSLTFANREGLGQVRIHVKVPRRDQRIVACVSVCARSVRLKGRGADPDRRMGVAALR